MTKAKLNWRQPQQLWPVAVAVLAACGGVADNADELSKAEDGAVATTPGMEVAQGRRPNSWVSCATEGGTCTVPSARNVRYGANGMYFYKNVSSAIGCNNAVWGDPAPGVSKRCDYSSASSTAPAPAPAPTANSLWTISDVPALPPANEPTAVNLGVTFSSSQVGKIVGMRFYKGVGNDGTHVGTLWSATGQKLAQGNFVGESATGWQTLMFSAPVAIVAGTSYTASYLAPVGQYSYATGTAWPTVSGPLSASAGVFAYSSASVFPTQTWSASNYWVDVLFTTTTAQAPAPAPAGSAMLSWTAAPGGGAGYRVYYGTASRRYDQNLGDGVYTTAINATVSTLSTGFTYYFAVTAVDATGKESAYSEEGSKVIQN